MKLIYKSSHWDEEQQRILVFLTNHRSFAASTIAAVYRQRWQIELFFKALKQKPAHQELRRHQPQRPANSDLDGADRPARAQVPATAGSLRLEPIQSGRSVAPAPARLSRAVGMDRPALPAAAAAGCRRRADRSFSSSNLDSRTATSIQPSQPRD